MYKLELNAEEKLEIENALATRAEGLLYEIQEEIDLWHNEELAEIFKQELEAIQKILEKINNLKREVENNVQN